MSEVKKIADRNRLVAQRKLSAVDRDREFAGSEVASNSKWLSASLLAINGAGALASLSAKTNTNFNWIAGGTFVIGILCSLLSGVILQEVYNRRIQTLSNNDEYWLDVTISGLRDGEMERKLNSLLARSERFSWLAPGAGWLSAIFFILGGYFLGSA